MANISSSSAFSFLIVLSVLLVAANNVPVSHGQGLTPIGSTLNNFLAQIPPLVSGLRINAVVIFNSVSNATTLILLNTGRSTVEGTINILITTTNVVLQTITTAATFAVSPVQGTVCSVVGAVSIGPVVAPNVTLAELGQILACFPSS